VFKIVGVIYKFRHTITIVNHRNQHVKNLKVTISEEVLLNLHIFNYLSNKGSVQTNTISTVRNIDSECGIFNVLAVFLRTRPRKTLIVEESGILNETDERIYSNFIHYHSPQD
jgi:hypothetical protein